MAAIGINQDGYTFIDLFAGAGGLSEGFIQAGFSPVAHVEMNEFAARTLETRTAFYYFSNNGNKEVYYEYLRGKTTREKMLGEVPDLYKDSVLCWTMTEQNITALFSKIDRMMKANGVGSIDVIIGGPPCQAYSLVGRAQSSHMEIPMSEDPRNGLYKLYARFLKRYQPKMFVFENVMGVKSANGGATWRNIQKYLRTVGYEIDCREQNASNFGVLQTRKRMIIVGWLKNSNLAYPDFEKCKSGALVNDLLNDLPGLIPGECAEKYSKKKRKKYVIETGIRDSEDILTLHASRPNKERDIEIYRKAIELWNAGHQRLNYNDLPDELKTHKNRTSFVDRFKVVEGDTSACHTVLAHLSKDGHYFIHPDIEQHRSITVREAARIQSFPDSYYFEGPRTAQFVQVGNAVPPMMARQIAEGLKRQLQMTE